jgi:hypothetical protein
MRRRSERVSVSRARPSASSQQARARSSSPARATTLLACNNRITNTERCLRPPSTRPRPPSSATPPRILKRIGRTNPLRQAATRAYQPPPAPTTPPRGTARKRPASEPSARCKRRRSPCPYRARGTHLTARPHDGPPQHGAGHVHNPTHRAHHPPSPDRTRDGSHRARRPRRDRPRHRDPRADQHAPHHRHDTGDNLPSRRQRHPTHPLPRAAPTAGPNTNHGTASAASAHSTCLGAAQRCVR